MQCMELVDKVLIYCYSYFPSTWPDRDWFVRVLVGTDWLSTGSNVARSTLLTVHIYVGCTKNIGPLVGKNTIIYFDV